MAYQKARFVALVALIKCFDAMAHHFFAIFDIVTVLETRCNTYKLRSGDCCVEDNDDDYDMTDYFTPCICARDNCIVISFITI